MMLRKKVCICGLYLINTAIIAASTLNATIAKENSQVINSLLQANWRIYAYNIIEESQSELREKFQFSHQDIQTYEFKPWFIDEDYAESIKQVIGKAIADCVTNMNEFKDKGPGELITFEGEDYEDRPEDYTQENWNAVVLYNYVNKYVRGKTGGVNDERNRQIMEECGKQLRTYYLTKYRNINLTLLEKAISQILTYVNALDIVGQMCKYRQYVKYIKGEESVNSQDLIYQYCFEPGIENVFEFREQARKYDSTRYARTRCSPIFIYINGSLSIKEISVYNDKRVHDIQYSNESHDIIYGADIYKKFNWVVRLFKGLDIKVLGVSEEKKRQYETKLK